MKFPHDVAWILMVWLVVGASSLLAQTDHGARAWGDPVDMRDLHPQQTGASGITSPTHTPVSGHSGYGIPACLYCPQPKYTPKAADARPLLMTAVITISGRATNISVKRGLGNGLDEKAVETVRTWRFRPALGPDDKPAAVLQTIVITFPSLPPAKEKNAPGRSVAPRGIAFGL
jgi:TonB family protein